MKFKLSVTILVITISIAVLSACSTSKKTSTDTAKTEAPAEKKYTATELEEGKMLWEKHCDRCHKLYLPENYTKDKWEKILPRMFKRSKLEGDNAGKVRGYLLSLAKEG